MSFLSVPEVAVQQGIPTEVLLSMCEQGLIKGAVRFGRIWALPEDFVYAERARPSLTVDCAPAVPHRHTRRSMLRASA